MKRLARAKQGEPAQAREYSAIELPKSSAIGFVTAFFAVVAGFALIWHIWWMAAFGVFGAFVALIVFAFRDEDEVEISAERIVRFEHAHQAEVAL
jgi:cytochrome o ubiquinol oxidase subunit 1